MSNHDRSMNPGSDAMENNLAGTRDEFNDEVTARLVDEAHSHKPGQEPRGPREEQPALAEDKESPAEPASS